MTNPNTNALEFTFERHCTQYLLPVPFTRYCLVLVESEVPRQWNILRGYGSFCFDFPAYHILVALMYIGVFTCHMLQIAGAESLFAEDDTSKLRFFSNRTIFFLRCSSPIVYFWVPPVCQLARSAPKPCSFIS